MGFAIDSIQGRSLLVGATTLSVMRDEFCEFGLGVHLGDLRIAAHFDLGDDAALCVLVRIDHGDADIDYRVGLGDVPELLGEFVAQAAGVLQNDHPANMVTLRGIARKPALPAFEEVCQMRAGAIAVYPMYRGLARLVGMNILDAGSSWADQVASLARHWNDYGFFFLHYKYTDAAGEDGDFERKVRCIEEFDAEIGKVMELQPDVVIVTGDHSTPALLRSHSWHPVPVLLAAKTCLPDLATSFGERQCLQGGLGQFQAKYLLPLALAHAGKLAKFGA